ncbi:hypothetical protein, partial [Acetobacter oeni]
MPTHWQIGRGATGAPTRRFAIGHAKAPPGPAGRGIAGTSVAVAAAVGAGPDQAVALAVLVIEE